MIPQEVLTRYSMLTLEEYRETFGEGSFAEINFYETFLIQTSHVVSEIIEQLIEDLSGATGTEFVEVYMKFIENIKGKYSEILQYRRSAREEIKKLEEERTLIEGENTDTNIS